MARRTRSEIERDSPEGAIDEPDGGPAEPSNNMPTEDGDDEPTAAGLRPGSGPVAPGRSARRTRTRTGRAASAEERTADNGDGAGPAREAQIGRGRAGSVAAETYAAVQELVRREGLTKGQAFERLGAERGRQPGTVAAAYYRAARAGGEGRPRAGARSAGRRPGRPPRQPAADAGRAVEGLREAIQELADLVRAQEADLTRLRAESERYGEIRAILGADGPRRGRPRRHA